MSVGMVPARGTAHGGRGGSRLTISSRWSGMINCMPTNYSRDLPVYAFCIDDTPGGVDSLSPRECWHRTDELTWYRFKLGALGLEGGFSGVVATLGMGWRDGGGMWTRCETDWTTSAGGRVCQGLLRRIWADKRTVPYSANLFVADPYLLASSHSLYPQGNSISRSPSASKSGIGPAHWVSRRPSRITQLPYGVSPSPATRQRHPPRPNRHSRSPYVGPVVSRTMRPMFNVNLFRMRTAIK